MDTPATALITTYITRCELGEDLSMGHYAEPFDRCTVDSKVFSWSSGHKGFWLRNDKGERFWATTHQAQLD